MPANDQPATTGEKRLVLAWRWARGAFAWLSPVLIAAGAILIGFSPDNEWPFGIGIVVSVLAVISQIVIGPRYARLIASERASTVRAAERATTIQKILHAGLRTMMDTLPVDFAQARISIYRHKGDHFIMLARVSDDLELQRPGRGRYPNTEGIIQKAWNGGSAVAVDLPEERSAWEQRCATEYKMDPASLRGLSMQALSIVGKRVDLTGGSQVVPVGLIVIESLAKRGVNGKTLDAVLSSAAYPLLEQVLIEAIACLDERDVEDFRSLAPA